MLWAVPYYSSLTFVDYVVPICYTRARWLDFLPPVHVNWLETDVFDLTAEELYGAFCELQKMYKKGRPIRDFRKKEELLVTWLRKRGFDIDEETFEMVRFTESRSQLRITERGEASSSRRRYLDDFPSTWKKWTKSDVQDEDREILRSLLEELYEQKIHNDDWRQTVNIIVEELEDQGWLWDEETMELEKTKKSGRKHLTDYAQSDKDKRKVRSDREVSQRSRSRATDSGRSERRERRTSQSREHHTYRETTAVVRKQKQSAQDRSGKAQAANMTVHVHLPDGYSGGGTLEQTTTTRETVRGKGKNRQPERVEEKSDSEDRNERRKSKKSKELESKKGKGKGKNRKQASEEEETPEEASEEEEDSRSEESEHRGKGKNKKAKDGKSDKGRGRSRKQDSSDERDHKSDSKAKKSAKGTNSKGKARAENISEEEPEEAEEEEDSNPQPESSASEHTIPSRGKLLKNAPHNFESDYASGSDEERTIMRTTTVTRKSVRSGGGSMKDYGSGYYRG